MRLVYLFLGLILFATCTDTELVGMQQLSKGAQLYKANCANCHQENGSGLAKLMPPLAESDYLAANFTQLPCLIRNGNRTPMVVNGITYTQAMPASPHLSEQDIAAICVFVGQKFLVPGQTLSDSVFKAVLKSCP
jgi:mono/diheme cytochrome c family protein